jgi:hypothetical protein
MAQLGLSGCGEGESRGVAATAALMARAVRREMAQPLSLSLFGFIELLENWIFRRRSPDL